jgi:hypothetical protein
MEETNAEMASGIAQLCLTEEWADVHFHVVVRLGEGEEEEVETEVLFRSFKVIQYFHVRLLNFILKTQKKDIFAYKK